MQIIDNNNMYKNGIPQFDGQKYAFFSRRMKTYIQAQGFEIWQSIVDGYKEPTIPSTNERALKLGQNNSAKEIWDRLQNIYEGDSKVKAAKLQTYRGQFEQLKMKEDENIATYFYESMKQ